MQPANRFKSGSEAQLEIKVCLGLFRNTSNPALATMDDRLGHWTINAFAFRIFEALLACFTLHGL